MHAHSPQMTSNTDISRVSSRRWFTEIALIAAVAIAGYSLAILLSGEGWIDDQQSYFAFVAAAFCGLLATLIVLQQRHTRVAAGLRQLRATEARLRLSEERFQDLFDHSPDMLATVDASTGEVLSCNQTLCDALDLPREELIGKPVFRLYHSSSLDKAHSAFRTFASIGEIRHLEIRLRRNDGSALESLLNANAVRDDQGKVLYSHSSWHDLSHRNRVTRTLEDLASSAGAGETFLRRCARDLGQIYNSKYAFVGVFDTAEKTAIRTLARWSKDRGFVDNQVYTLAGTPCEDVLNRALELISYGVAELYSEDVALAEGQMESYCGVPLVTSGGEILGLISVVDSNPIPEHHFARPLHHIVAKRIAHELEQESWSKALTRSEERYRRLIEGLRSSFVYAADARGRLTFVSPAVTTLLGYSTSEYMQRHFQLLSEVPENASAFRQAQATLRGEEQPRYEAQLIAKDAQHRYVEISERPVFDSDGQVVAVEGMVTDITARRQAEAQVRVRNRVLEMIAQGAELGAVLNTLCQLLEQQRTGIMAAVLLMDADGRTLHAGAAPTLPADYAQALARMPIGPASGSCGPAALIGQPVFVADVRTDPQWADFRALAEHHGVRACWSTLVKSDHREVLGTVSLSLHDTAAAGKQERELLRMAGQVAAIAIQKDLAKDALKRSEARFRDFASIAADYLWEMGPDLRFTFISDRYHDITGLDPRRLLKCSQQDLVAAQMAESELWTRHLEDLNERRTYDTEFSWMKPDGTTIVLNHRGRPVFGETGEFQGYRGTGSDVTNAHLLSEQLAYQASHDSLTGLTNRAEFESRLRGALNSARTSGAEHALCYLDLDQFKVVNDTCGHVAGDELLRQLSQLLRARVRKRDTLARLGGDEFGILMERCPLDDAHRVADALRRSVEDFRFHWEGKIFTVGISIGLVPINRASFDTASILRAADTACYAAKDEGRNRIHVYHEKDTEVARRQGEMQWISRIGSALENDQLRLFAQSIKPVAAENTGGEHYELLLRMVDDNGEIILPGAFLPAAERYNIATKLDRWIVCAARQWFTEHPEQLERLEICSVNLSGQSLGDPHFLRFVMDQFSDGALPAERFCFEITETAAIGNLTRASTFINSLKEMGCRFSLDDFGSGLSSFAYLKSLAVDFLKIDGIFVKDIVTDSMDMAMVRSINEIGHVMGKKTVAEFVENTDILSRLQEIGVDYAQGYHIAMPIPIEQLEHAHGATT